jgi:uncharacterized protein YcbX
VTDAVGSVASLWRYPVKSLQGIEVDRVTVGDAGIDGDRRRALVEEAGGTLMSAKRWSRLLDAAADDDGITLPDGSRAAYADDDVDPLLSDWLERPVHLDEASAATEVAYEMTFDPPDDSAEFVPIPAPPGTFLDLAAGHLLTSATLESCAAARPDLDWDVRRFRPNLVVDGPKEPFAEDEWCGGRLRIGSAVLAARQPTVRCAMPLRAQPGLDRQAALYEALDEIHGNHLGIYLDSVEPGEIAIGDPVTLEPA